MTVLDSSLCSNSLRNVMSMYFSEIESDSVSCSPSASSASSGSSLINGTKHSPESSTRVETFHKTLLQLSNFLSKSKTILFVKGSFVESDKYSIASDFNTEHKLSTTSDPNKQLDKLIICS